MSIKCLLAYSYIIMVTISNIYSYIATIKALYSNYYLYPFIDTVLFYVVLTHLKVTTKWIFTLLWQFKVILYSKVGFKVVLATVLVLKTPVPWLN